MIIATKDRFPYISYNAICSYYGITKSGFFKFKKKLTSGEISKKQIQKFLIKQSYDNSGGTYGSKRIYWDLKGGDDAPSENTTAKYMREMGLDARLKKKYHKQTTDSNHSGPFVERKLATEDKTTMPTKPREILAGDITYLELSNGKVFYLAVVMDVYTREIIGWFLDDNLKSSLVVGALRSALHVLDDMDTLVIFHSDRGSQYASEVYRSFLEDYHIIPSMSRRGNCYDNAFVESFFATLKKEWFHRVEKGSLKSKEDVQAGLFQFIEAYYNRKRIHSSLGYKTPVEFRKLALMEEDRHE